MKFKMLKQIVGLLALITTAFSSVGSEMDLRAFLTDTSTLRAGFMQRVQDESGVTLELSRGTFYLSRPGKFRWDYRAEGSGDANDEPELGQQIVADGESLFFYDPDLEQVSQRSLSGALSQVPSLLLAQSGAELDEHFHVGDLGMTDGLSWVTLKPKAEDAGYQQLMIGFDQGQVSSLMLYDGLGNTTRLEFKELAVNPVLDESLFDFTLPPGADVLSD